MKQSIPAPFFIVGSPRSGTTMLREILRQIPGLYCPEETHFYRWATPLASPEYTAQYTHNNTLRKHREIDGVTDDAFFKLYSESLTRAELTKKYGDTVCAAKNMQQWFDKTPQNVYGLPLLAAQFKSSKIIHIHRNPYAVVKSFLVGEVFHIPSVIGAANYWAEAMQIIAVTKPYLKKRLVEISYERLVRKDEREVRKLQKALKLKAEDLNLSSVYIKEDEDFTQVFSNDDLETIRKICTPFLQQYGYAPL